jgi:PAS domain S-box-containing protein
MSGSSKPIKIGIIGGGRRCKALLEMLDNRRLPNFNAEVAAVADPDLNGVGMVLARKKSIYTTGNYRELRDRTDLDFIIELTGKRALLDDVSREAPPEVRVLESAISSLVLDVIRFRNEYLLEKRQLDINESIVESMFSSIHDDVLLLRPDFKILDANEAFLRTIGMTKDEVVGKYCYQIVHGLSGSCQDQGELCPFTEVLETGNTSHAVHEHIAKHGRILCCEVNAVPLKNENGEVELVLSIMRDITAAVERRLQERTKTLKRDLAQAIHEDKMIALGKLVSGAVHEINNPLSGILALARLMRRQMEEGSLSEEDGEQFKYYLHLIDTEAARCSTIVSGLLSFSRQQKTEYKYFELNDLIQKVVFLFDHKMQAGRVRLSLELAAELPQILGDPGQVQQCLINLLFNGMEAMPGGGQLTMRTSVEGDREQVRLEVEDTGIGIPEEMMSQVFEPFVSTKQHEKGVGLGLSVVYGIIKEHHGSIYVRSLVGQGTTFTIRLPVTQPAGGSHPGKKRTSRAYFARTLNKREDAKCFSEYSSRLILENGYDRTGKGPDRR